LKKVKREIRGRKGGVKSTSRVRGSSGEVKEGGMATRPGEKKVGLSKGLKKEREARERGTFGKELWGGRSLSSVLDWYLLRREVRGKRTDTDGGRRPSILRVAKSMVQLREKPPEAKEKRREKVGTIPSVSSA